MTTETTYEDLTHESRVLDQVELGRQQRRNEEVIGVPQQSDFKLVQQTDDVLPDVLGTEAVALEQQHYVVGFHHSYKHRHQHHRLCRLVDWYLPLGSPKSRGLGEQSGVQGQTPVGGLRDKVAHKLKHFH